VRCGLASDAASPQTAPPETTARPIRL